ncbi:MAG TPA: hypothetical protein VGS11_04725 [Candidatus Bathyarchaeia archaeon]|nr:hypothetical protein [Candidatus Bathyarchaeia archaeon]
MANGLNGVKRKRRPAQKGVQAVFTADVNWKGRTQIAIGLIAIGFGTAAWVYSSRGLGELGVGNLIPWDSSASAFLLPVSIPLLIGGVGLCTYYFTMRRTWRASSLIESALYELEALVVQRSLSSGFPEAVAAIEAKPTGRRPFHLPSKALAIALVEAVVMIMIYGGIVQEYGSNVNMRNWVQANFAPGEYLLNYYGVLILAGVLGVAIFQIIPRSLQARKLQAPFRAPSRKER